MHTERTPWKIIGHATKDSTEYVILQAIEHGKVKVYNVARVGWGWPEGGYYNLDALLKLKGIRDFTLNSVLSLA